MSQLILEFGEGSEKKQGLWVIHRNSPDISECRFFLFLSDILCAFEREANPNDANPKPHLMIVTKQNSYGFVDLEERGLEKLERAITSDEYFKIMAICPYTNDGEHRQVYLMREGFHFAWRNETQGLSFALTSENSLGVTYLREATQLGSDLNNHLRESFFQHPTKPETYMSKSFYPDLVKQGLEISIP